MFGTSCSSIADIQSCGSGSRLSKVIVSKPTLTFREFFFRLLVIIIILLITQKNIVYNCNVELYKQITIINVLPVSL